MVGHLERVARIMYGRFGTSGVACLDAVHRRFPTSGEACWLDYARMLGTFGGAWIDDARAFPYNENIFFMMRMRFRAFAAPGSWEPVQLSPER